MRLRPGLRPNPAGGGYSAERSPSPLAGFKVSGEGKGKEVRRREMRGREREVRGREEGKGRGG